MKTIKEILTSAGPQIPPEQPVIGPQHEFSEPNPKPMSEVIADRLAQYGEIGAKALEDLGIAAVEDAHEFKDECYRNARILRKQATDKAMDTIWYVQQMRAFHDLANGPKKLPILPTQVEAPSVASDEGTSNSPNDSAGASVGVRFDGPGLGEEVPKTG